MNEQQLIDYLEDLVRCLKAGQVIEGNIEFHPDPEVVGRGFIVDGVVRYFDGVVLVRKPDGRITNRSSYYT